MKGILLVDKPAGMTSHDVVDVLRKSTGIRKIGHTGTLDPGATGLLIMCIGKATRLSEHLMGMDKTYEGTMRFGVVTSSYDMQGEVLEEHEVPEITDAQLEEAMKPLTGDLMQVPPMVSAVKVGGQRLYKLARQGETVERPPRPVTVYEFSLLENDSPIVKFRVRCSSGTYVRSLCHDIGQHFGCGAALESLRRTRIGSHSIENASPLDALSTPEEVESRLISIGDALDYPEVVVQPKGKTLISSGNAVFPIDIESEIPDESGWIQVKSSGGELLALGKIEECSLGTKVVPKRVLVSGK
jgi:tRNA pseudouridine55 synthase